MPGGESCTPRLWWSSRRTAAGRQVALAREATLPATGQRQRARRTSGRPAATTRRRRSRTASGSTRRSTCRRAPLRCGSWSGSGVTARWPSTMWSSVAPTTAPGICRPCGTARSGSATWSAHSRPAPAASRAAAPACRRSGAWRPARPPVPLATRAWTSARRASPASTATPLLGSKVSGGWTCAGTGSRGSSGASSTCPGCRNCCSTAIRSRLLSFVGVGAPTTVPIASRTSTTLVTSCRATLSRVASPVPAPAMLLRFAWRRARPVRCSATPRWTCTGGTSRAWRRTHSRACASCGPWT
mmetsp:Transcript_76737/g.248425  ORF Transcript_76737/g.248425 Transcript_76737/m.248425 type:complete len:300 (+) Transcript_76737:741-1640(+)